MVALRVRGARIAQRVFGVGDAGHPSADGGVVTIAADLEVKIRFVGGIIGAGRCGERQGEHGRPEQSCEFFHFRKVSVCVGSRGRMARRKWTTVVWP